MRLWRTVDHIPSLVARADQGAQPRADAGAEHREQGCNQAALTVTRVLPAIRNLNEEADRQAGTGPDK
jgi:hypothetical protein